MDRNTCTSFQMLFDKALGLSDIKIRIGAVESNSWVFPAHQLVLRASSPVFNAMLSGEYEETRKEVIKIEDISPNIFYRVWLYIYKGELEVQSVTEVLGVYTAADKYQIENLKTACAEEIGNFPINWDIFWDLLHQCFNDCFPAVPFQLKLKLMVFIDENARGVLTSKNFLFLSRELVMMIISRNSLQDISELVVCKALLEWAEMQCLKTNVEPTAENQRMILGDAFYKMKLTTVDKKDLMSSRVYKLLKTEEIADIFQDNENSVFFTSSSYRGKQSLIQRGYSINGYSFGTTFFVFAKDAFVHKLIIGTTEVNNIILTALNKGENDTLVSYSVHDTKLTSFFVKAFVCYKLSIKFEGDQEVGENNCLLSGPLGYESLGTNTAVFFSFNDNFVSDYSNIVSPHYWKNVFSTQTFEPDDCYTCIKCVRATFC